jgi:hypothetical protein
MLIDDKKHVDTKQRFESENQDKNIIFYKKKSWMFAFI